MARLTSELVVKLTDQVSGPAAKIAGALNKATGDLAKVKGYKEQSDRLKELARAHELARDKVKSLASALIAADNPSKRMQASYAAATAAVDKLGNKMDWQKARVNAAAGALSAMGVSVKNLAAGEAMLKANIDKATAAIVKQERSAQRWAGRRQAASTIAGGVGLTAGYQGRRFAGKAITSAAEFDIGVRKQRAFTDIGEGDQAGLIAQAKRIGQDTPFTNLDVVKAQTKAMQGLPSGITGKIKAEVAEGILNNVKNYAMVMEADLETSAEAIRSYLQQTNKNIGTKEKALAESNKATNQLVKMAKIGGMSDDDVQGFMKFAAASGTAAGLTPETMMSMAALARRGGLRGDEAGTFVRSAAGKLTSPTKQGRAALSAAGINFDDYVSMPDKLDAGRLEGQFKTDLGKGFTPKVRAKLDTILADKKTIGDRGNFQKAVVDAVSEMFPKTKKGTISAMDSHRIAKSAGTFHKVSAQSVDTERLLNDAFEKKMTLPQLNAWLTDKHGGKGAITQNQWDEFGASRKAIASVGDDPDFAKKKADEIMGGLGGSLNNLKGSVETLILNLGTANEGLLKFSMDGIGKAFDGIANMDNKALQAASALGVLAAGAGAAVGAWTLTKMLLGVGGQGAALTASAVALDGSAAALTAAAARLGVAGSVGAVAGAGGAGTVAAVAGGITAGGVAAVAAIAAGAAVIVQDYKPAGTGVTKGNALPGQEHDDGQKRRRSLNDVYRQRMDEFKKINGDGSDPTAGSPFIPRMDTSSLDAAGTKAGEVKDKLSELNQTVTPTVNLASVLQLESAIDRVLSKMQQVGASAGAAKSAVAGIGTATAGRGRSDVGTATANLSRSRQTNMTDRSYTG
jgi:hypothetical protein